MSTVYMEDDDLSERLKTELLKTTEDEKNKDTFRITESKFKSNLAEIKMEVIDEEEISMDG